MGPQGYRQQSVASGPPPAGIWGSRHRPGTGIPWRGVHETAIGCSGTLQPVSRETGKYLLLCSLDLAVKSINYSNRQSRDCLQSATGVADLLLCSLIWTGKSQNTQ